MSVMHKFLEPWVFVSIGVAMTLISAVMNHYVIKHNDERIQELQIKSEQIDQQVDSLWANANRFERNGNAALLLAYLSYGQLNNRAMDKKLVAAIDRILSRGESRPVNRKKMLQSKKQLNTILDEIDQQRSRAVEKINDLYYERVLFNQQIRNIEYESASYLNIALFFQIMGLIFVLLKDVKRWEY